MSLERRGRPRKLDMTISPTTPIFEEKPREERSYKDFFPDLNIKEPLPIIKTLDSFSFINSDLTVDTLKSPSNDEYETASEGELSNIEKATKLPVASFKRIGESDITKQDESLVFHRPENHYIRYIGELKNTHTCYPVIRRSNFFFFFCFFPHRTLRIRII